MIKIVAWILSVISILNFYVCNNKNAETNENTYMINGTKRVIADYTDTEEKMISYLYDKGFTDITIVDTENITLDMLENRNNDDTIIVERAVGMVTNKNSKDGIILNTSREDYNYISYRNVDFKVCDGTIIISYFVYNPDTNYIDDIIERYDFVLDREYED